MTQINHIPYRHKKQESRTVIGGGLVGTDVGLFVGVRVPFFFALFFDLDDDFFFDLEDFFNLRDLNFL